MRGLVAALGALLACGMTAVAGPAQAESKETEEFTIGQWGGYSYTDSSNGQFIDCEIWAPANSDNVQFGIAIPKDYSLELWLYSKAWSLPANKSYPISYWIDRNQQYRGRAETNSGKYVFIKVDRDQDVYDQLKAGNQVTFRTQDQDYVFGLAGSRAALSRLLDCVDQYSTTASANPFGGGNEPSNDNQQQGSQQQQQSSGFEGPSDGGGPDLSMDTFTQTVAQVRQFLVDVTGAKPSMIAVDEKVDNDGIPYYQLRTPLGDGQFWQEKLGGRDLGKLASSYLDDYKQDCSGSFEPVVNDVVRGDRGTLATGGAACSSSKYQDNGPEYLSYAVLESDDVVSFYMTYVGGNAAKAKIDGLGKLIAKRIEETLTE